MTRGFWVTVAVLLAVFAAGLKFGWGFWLFERPDWRYYADGWAYLALAALAASAHPWCDKADERLRRYGG